VDPEQKQALIDAKFVETDRRPRRVRRAD